MKNLNKLSEKFDKYFWMIVLTIGLIQVLLIGKMTIYQRGYSIHDDILMIDHAENILSGDYLGDYTNKTLLKRISYPIFLSLCNILNIPYLTGLGLFWVFSAILFIFAIRKAVTNKKILFLMYIFILFNPVMYSFKWAQSMYRNSIIAPATLLVLATLIGMYYSRDKNKSFIVWGIGVGISFSFFWNIREDTIWLLPFFICAILVGAVKWILQNKGATLKKCIEKITLFALPIMLFCLSCVITQFVNYKYYGLYSSNELYDSNFREMINILNTLDENPKLKSEKGITISRETMDKLYEVSPSLASIKDEIQKYVFNSFWQTIGDNINDGEVYGGYIYWAMRDAVQAAGYYKDAKTADDFYGKVCEEVRAAIDNGSLKVEENNGINILGIELFGNNEQVFKAFFNNIDIMLDYENIYYSTEKSVGNVYNLRRTEKITGNVLIYPDVTESALSGCIVPEKTTDTVELYLLDENDNVIRKLKLQQSDDVYEYYKQQGIENEKSRYAYFEYNEENSKVKALAVYVNSQEKEKIEFSGISDKMYQSEWFTMHIYVAENIVNSDVNSDTNDNLYNGIINIYKKISNALTVASIIMLLVIFVLKLLHKDKNDNGYIFILLGLVASYLVLQYGVATLYYQEKLAYKGWGYLAPACVLQGVFISLSMGYGIIQIVNIIKKKNNIQN